MKHCRQHHQILLKMKKKYVVRPKEQKRNSQIENDSQSPQNKLASIVRDSMLKNVDGYLLTGSKKRKYYKG